LLFLILFPWLFQAGFISFFLDFPGGGIDVRSSLSGESGKIAGGEAD